MEHGYDPFPLTKHIHSERSLQNGGYDVNMSEPIFLQISFF